MCSLPVTDRSEESPPSGKRVSRTISDLINWFHKAAQEESPESPAASPAASPPPSPTMLHSSPAMSAQSGHSSPTYHSGYSSPAYQSGHNSPTYQSGHSSPVTRSGNASPSPEHRSPFDFSDSISHQSKQPNIASSAPEAKQGSPSSSERTGRSKVPGSKSGSTSPDSNRRRSKSPESKRRSRSPDSRRRSKSPDSKRISPSPEESKRSSQSPSSSSRHKPSSPTSVGTPEIILPNTYSTPTQAQSSQTSQSHMTTRQQSGAESVSTRSVGESTSDRPRNLNMSSERLKKKGVRRSISKPVKAAKKKPSDLCFIALFWAIVIVQLWCNIWLLQLLAIPTGLLVLKKLGKICVLKGKQ